MKVHAIMTSALFGAATALPSVNDIGKRQMTENDIKSGGSCKKVTLVFARATGERGNIGGSMGPATCRGLKSKFPGQVACQGVGEGYAAALMDNMAPAGTSQAGITEAISMFDMAASKCPQTVLVGGGYSQGSAVMMNAVSKLKPAVKNRVAGVVLFGYTKNAQQKSGIPNYPKDNVKVFCSNGDGVCGGQLIVNMAHFSYMTDGSGPGAVNFLVEKISGAKSRGNSDESEENEESAVPSKSSKGSGFKGLGKGKGGSRALEDTSSAPPAMDELAVESA